MQKQSRTSATPWTGLCLALSLLTPSLALAAPPPSPAIPASEAARKDEAKKHFETGRELDQKGDVAGSLREFLASRAMFKTRGNTLNAALALRKLGRIGEALDLLEAYLKDFENTSPDDKTMVEGEIAATTQFVGKLAIETSTAAQIVIDDVVRGRTPLAAPIRLAAGTHVVRLQPESFAARRYETTVTVAAQQSVSIKPEFEELAEHGGLNVKAASGGTFDVLLDGKVVGQTPLSLQLAPRDYAVALRGPDEGSMPQKASLSGGRVQDLTITTQKLDATVDVQVDPPDATLVLDGVPLGRGAWRGAITRGQHEFRAEAPGFSPRTVRATLGAAESSLRIDLKRGGGAAPEDGAAVSSPSSVGGFAELDVGLALGLVNGGSLRAECTGSCSSTFMIGPKLALRAGITVKKRFELGTEISYQHMPEHIQGRPDSVAVVGQPAPANGFTNDVVKWNTVGVGVVGGVRVGPDKIPITLRLAAGTMLGSISDRRNGSYDAGTGIENAQNTKTTQAAIHFYVAPEVRAGYQLTEHLSAGIGVRGTFAFDLARPRWDSRKPTVLERSGLAYWNSPTGSGSAGERLLGATRVLLDPALYVRYDF